LTNYIGDSLLSLDHILSYFLGGDHSNNSTDANPTGFATFHAGSFTSSVGDLSSQGNESQKAPTIMEEEQEGTSGGGVLPIPPTPNVQHFYSSSSKNKSKSQAQPTQQQQHHPFPPPTSRNANIVNSGSVAPYNSVGTSGMVLGSSGSASSLSTMAAALVSGGPLGLQQPKQQQQGMGVAAGSVSPLDCTYQSPITPVALIGATHETLMLPPVGNVGLATQQQQYSQQHPMAEQQRQALHLAWLQSLNATAQQAGQQGQTPLSNEEGGNSGHQQHMPIPAVSSATYNPHLLSNTQYFASANEAVSAAAASTNKTNSPAVESEEKRAKRLERNRESARKSRRRKKEKLTTLGTKVRELQISIEVERKKHIREIVPCLMNSCRFKAITNDSASYEELSEIIRGTGACSQIFLTVLDFQYSTLRQMLLPRYQEMLLFFNLVNTDTFFTAGKENFILKYKQNNAAGKNGGSKQPSGKISSKQVGDDLTNGPDRKTSGPPIPGGEDEPNTNPGSQTAYAFDGARTWPLFCYELKLSVEQEEKFVAVQRRMKDNSPHLEESKSQTAAAVRTAESSREAVESLCRVVSQREEHTYLGGLLSPAQVCAYNKWLSNNRARCREQCRKSLLEGRRQEEARESMVTQSSPGSRAAYSPKNDKESSLLQICKRLSEVLQISKGERLM